MPIETKEEERSQVCRYPGVFTDWSGRYLSTRLREHITIGNIVRVPFVDIKGEENSGFCTYFRIVKRCKKHAHLFVGVCEDPYHGDDPSSPITNGDKRVFCARDVSEVPLEWQGNENLRKKAEFRDFYRGITGCISLSL